ncbi:MAG: ATP-binding protein [Planctomycetota bacterium]
MSIPLLEAKISRAQFLFFGAAMGLVVLLVDTQMPLGVAGGVPYVALVVFSIWSPVDRDTYLAAIVGSLLTILGYFISPDGGDFGVVWSNRFLVITAIWMVAGLLVLHKNAVRQLQESQRVLATLLSNLPGMAYRGVHQPDCPMVFVSDGAFSLTGYPPGQLMGDQCIPFNEITHEEDREQVWLAIEEGIANKCSFTMTYRILCRDGKEKWVWEQGQGVFDPITETQMVEGFITDITELKQLEEQLHQSQKMEAIGKLAGGVAHDFNNLLQAINGYADIAMLDLKEEDRAHHSVKEIGKAGQRAAVLVRQLLAFSRRQVLDMEDIDLNTVVVDVANMLRRLIGPQVRLEIESEADVGSITADAVQVQQILVNLCVNARDAMEGGGLIRVQTANVLIDEETAQRQSWAEAGSYALLSVTDHGCGMSEEQQGSAFEPFYTTKGVGEGTGLGLATVYGLVKQHRGLVRLLSEVNRGTTVEVYFPRRKVPESVADHVGHAPVIGGQETLLVVEDEEAILTLATAILSQAGYKVLQAKDGLEALELLEVYGEEIALVLLDVMMPNLGGKGVYDATHQRFPKLLYLFSSGYSANGIHTDFILHEDLQLLQKPYRNEDLLQRVREVLDTANEAG